MKELLRLIEANRRICLIAAAALMLVFFAFCPAIDIMGKATATGLKVVFKGSGLGFSRLVSTLMLIVPIVVIVAQFVKIKTPAGMIVTLEDACFIAGIVLFILLVVALPEHTSLALGSYPYFVAAILGLAAANTGRISSRL